MATGSRGSPTCVHSHIVLGNFSTDEKGEYCDDDRDRKFFVQPDDEPNFDLTEGFDEFVDVPEHGMEPVSMTSLLMWMRDHSDTLQENGILDRPPGGSHLRFGVDFVSQRGVLSELLRAAYSNERQEILVTLHRGTYYIEGCRDQAALSDSHKILAFGGHKFRQFVTSVDGYHPDTFLPVNANETYNAVIKAECGGQSLLYSADIRGERQESKNMPPQNYLSIKTCKAGRPVAKFKTLTWWTQCTLTGISEIVCGCRDDDRHVINEVKTYTTDDLLALARDYNWTPECCLKKMNSLLHDIKEKVQDEDPRTVYKLVLEEVERGRGQFQRQQARKFVVRGRVDDDYVILKDWYLREVLGEE